MHIFHYNYRTLTQNDIIQSYCIGLSRIHCNICETNLSSLGFQDQQISDKGFASYTSRINWITQKNLEFPLWIFDETQKLET